MSYFVIIAWQKTSYNVYEVCFLKEHTCNMEEQDYNSENLLIGHVI